MLYRTRLVRHYNLTASNAFVHNQSCMECSTMIKGYLLQEKNI
jgi:hypothetical protein